MSIVEVKVPELSESVSEASLIEWKKKVGEPVKADEILIEIETDKIVLEIPAPADGVLASIEQPDGAAVLSDQLIATIDTEGMVGAQPEAPKAAVAEEVIISTPAAAPGGSHRNHFPGVPHHHLPLLHYAHRCHEPLSQRLLRASPAQMHLLPEPGTAIFVQGVRSPAGSL